MRVYVVGKVNNVTGWLEGCVAALRLAGCTVRVGVTRNPAFSTSLERRLHGPPFGPGLPERIARDVRRFRPDIVLCVLAYTLPQEVLAHLAAQPSRPPLVGWVGDRFGEEARGLADSFDLVAYTDTGMVADHRRLGFAAPAIYLPHAAAAPRALRPLPPQGDELVFVGSPSDNRIALFAAMRTQLRLYGPGWTGQEVAAHAVTAARVRPRELARLYAGALGVVNAPNEQNVLVGLNQRNFDPYMYATPVIAQRQGDLERCFEIGTQVLAYGSAAELDAACAELKRSPGLAQQIGRAGRERVLAEHTYPRRLQQMREAL